MESKIDLIPIKVAEREKAMLWSLVLSAVGIPHHLANTENGWVILVPEESSREAVRQIELFELENKKDEKDGQTPKSNQIRYARKTLWTLLVLSALMSVTFRYEIRDLLLEAGAADSDRMLDGQWWRAITALFLHADPSHFFSNVAIGGFIVFWLIEETGPGTGWFLTLFTGACGNWLNAMAHGHDGHLSIGASTAVFGAMGTLFAIRAVKSGRSGVFRETARILAAGMALLAMLGSGKGRVDMGAHFFGFTVGLFTGGATAFFREYLPRDLRNGGRILGILAVLAAAAAWTAAALHYLKVVP